MKGNMCLYIGDESNQAIIKQGNKQGGIIADNEQSRIIWFVNTNIGTYSIPFKTKAEETEESDSVTLALDIRDAGTPSEDEIGKLVVSTYHTGHANVPFPANSDNYFTDVTSINNEEDGDISESIVDRYWLICFEDYSTKPTVSASFSYDAVGDTNDMNDLNEANLQAQFWDGSEWLSSETGSAEPFNNRVTGVSNINFNAPWTLSYKDSPLPIDLLLFNAECIEEKVYLKWLTANETNNDYFTVEKSSDAQNWEPLLNIDGAGNSNSYLYYTTTDDFPYSEMSYYRLKQTDFDGNFTTFTPISVSCKSEINNTIKIFPNPAIYEISLEINSFKNINGMVNIFSNNGSNPIRQDVMLFKGKNIFTIDVSKLSEGIYTVIFNDESGTYIRSVESLIIKGNK